MAAIEEQNQKQREKRKSIRQQMREIKVEQRSEQNSRARQVRGTIPRSQESQSQKKPVDREHEKQDARERRAHSQGISAEHFGRET